MTKLKTTLTISAIASILIIGGFTVAPDAYSTYGGWGDDDDCEDYYGYHHDDCDDEPQTGKIIVNKAITNDNGGNAESSDFTIKITNTKTGEELILEHSNEDNSLNVNEIPVGTYKMSETVADNVTGTYTTVLITGNNKCPSMMDEKFKIKQGKKIECTIYNDDDFIDGQTGEPGAGVVFRPTSVTVTPGMITNFVLPDDGGSVTIDASGDSIIIIDPEFQESDAQNLIVIFTIIDAADSGNPIQCFSEGIVDAGESNGFRIACAEALESDQYILNYALIKTIVLDAAS